jgi:hypothetical protein
LRRNRYRLYTKKANTARLAREAAAKSERNEWTSIPNLSDEIRIQAETLNTNKKYKN